MHSHYLRQWHGMEQQNMASFPVGCPIRDEQSIQGDAPKG